MNPSLLLTTLGLFFVLVVIERLASRALREEAASWHLHYAAIPKTAAITADLRWNHTWITAYLDSMAGETGSLQVVALRPLSPREHANCLRWLRAEGFADATICRTGDDPVRWNRDFPI
jgi:hypothetical protein